MSFRNSVFSMKLLMGDRCEQLPLYSLVPCNNHEWLIAAGDQESGLILERLADAMSLERSAGMNVNPSARKIVARISDVPAMAVTADRYDFENIRTNKMSQKRHDYGL